MINKIHKIRIIRLKVEFINRKFKIPRKKIDIKIINNYVDNFIKNSIEDKIIPDIVLEILSYNKVNEDVSLYSTEYKAHLEVLDRIITKVVRDMSRFIVRDSTDNLVSKYNNNYLINKYNKET